MPAAETNKTGESGGKSKLISSDAPTPTTPAQAQAEEPQYVVDGKSVSREAYFEALPKAGYVPERMPANFYPVISTK